MRLVGAVLFDLPFIHIQIPKEPPGFFLFNIFLLDSVAGKYSHMLVPPFTLADLPGRAHQICPPT